MENCGVPCTCLDKEEEREREIERKSCQIRSDR